MTVRNAWMCAACLCSSSTGQCYTCLSDKHHKVRQGLLWLALLDMWLTRVEEGIGHGRVCACGHRDPESFRRCGSSSHPVTANKPWQPARSWLPAC